MTGRVHSIQSLGAVDGPGLRSVVFLQGCPLRCAYCHNPDTWDFSGGTETDAGELVERLLRFRGYWGKNCGPRAGAKEKDGKCLTDAESADGLRVTGGSPITGGVTVSGGEPLVQSEFVREVFTRLHEAGVHTALDTSGAGDLKAAEEVLREADLALVDLKFLSEEEYRKFCHGSLERTERFLELTERLGVPIWVRHVAVPGLTAEVEYMQAVKDRVAELPNLQKLEFLPFHNMCREKYERMGIPFPLADVEVMESVKWEELLKKIH